jgi:hypothetical protein
MKLAIEIWAREEGYLFCTGDDETHDGDECCGWVDYDDNPVDIVALYNEAHR